MYIRVVCILKISAEGATVVDNIARHFLNTVRPLSENAKALKGKKFFREFESGPATKMLRPVIMIPMWALLHLEREMF